MLEHRSQPLIPLKAFYTRVFKCFILTVLLVFFSLLLGVFGYASFGDYPLPDAIYRSSIILSEQELPDNEVSDPIKLFESFFLLYARLIFFSVIALLATPILHRVLHKLHLDVESDAGL
ncbi:MAG: hypothetical protein AAF492_04765 [Verrucomicrobiota bacterium]